MIRRLKAVFDGDVLRPTQPLDLKPNTEVQITLNVPDNEETGQQSFLDTAQNLQLDGPAGWSSNVDAYLYGSVEGADE